MRRTMIRTFAAAVVTAGFAAGLVAAPGTAAASTEQIFIAYGVNPPDAHAAALRQMEAYSPTCQEVSTTYSPAGSGHTWKATLTALC
ncbi:hypothetical protein GCM10022225_73440 [Plantactinospora mayteni]|uniref:Uncharacterized protein n=1 Tax=Plantactinospora mayteni TaxID=566021 RepID=A0ABQ4F1K3_9ACTN|nr:hypothetical protein [Plantactinospora mayteni]GIH00799.1 hypothetical protein Pma05_73710 [Plantactinospora mayteni]